MDTDRASSRLKLGDFRIHDRLLADCHRLGTLNGTHLLLHRNAALPWFILVPETSAVDLLDLPAETRDRLVAEAAALSTFLKTSLGCPKVNFAAIGNLVPQLHLHVVGRRPGDACWPAPVWGHLEASSGYTAAELAALRARLAEAVSLESPDR